MKFKTGLKIYFLFWLLYIPISLILMQFYSANFTVVMLIGLKIIIIYLLFENFSKKKVVIKKQVQENAPWFNVFKPNFGRIEYDLN